MPIHGAAEEAKAFLEELVTRRSSTSLLARSELVLERLFSHFEEEQVRDLRAVDERHLVSFVHFLLRREKPLSSWTVAAYVSTVRSFFAWLSKRGKLLRDPALGLRVGAGRRLPRRVLSEREARRLMAAPWPGRKSGLRDLAVLETLYGSGLRLRETTMLDVADLDLREGTLFVRGGKGRKDRLVPLTRRAIVALDLYLRDARPALQRNPREALALFLSQEARRLSPITLGQRLRRYGRMTLGRAVSPHDLRHACATHLLQGGADIRHVQAILGHESIETTAIYTKVDASELRRVIERSHPRERHKKRRSVSTSKP